MKRKNEAKSSRKTNTDEISSIGQIKLKFENLLWVLMKKGTNWFRYKNEI